MFIPSDLEEQKILATGIYGTNVVAVRGNYDDVNRLCTELSGEHEWAFVNINMRPYYAEGSKTLAYETAEQLGLRAARPGGRADRLGLAVHQDRPRLRGVDRSRPARGRAARLQRRPGRRAARRWRRRSRPAQDYCRPVKPDTIAKSLAIGNPADGPYALDLARSSGGSIDSVTDDEIREGIKLLAQTTGIFTETAGGVTTAVLAKLAERGDIDPDERVVALHHRRGPEDARLSPAERSRRGRSSPNVDVVRARRRTRRRAGIDCRAPMPVSVKIPTQLRAATEGEAQASVDGSTVGEVLDALYERYGELRSRIAEDGGLRRFVNVYVDGEDIRFLDGLDTEVKDGDEVTILPAVAGG